MEDGSMGCIAAVVYFLVDVAAVVLWKTADQTDKK